MKHKRVLLLLAAAILLIPLFFAIRSRAKAPAAQNTPTSPAPAATSIPPSASPSAEAAQQPPPCTFPLAQTTTAESKPEDYTFSEPHVVLTTGLNLYSLVEWLPDNERVLITHDLYSARETESDKMLRQSIELYNPETGESQVYATRYHIDEPPAWQAAANAVVYPAMNYLGREKNTNIIQFTRQVWVSYGDPHATQMLAENLAQFPITVKPGGSEVAYLSDKELSKRNASLQSIPGASFEAARWDYAKARRSELPVSYAMAWQPGTSLVFLYSEGGMQNGGGYTFVLNADTGQVCELDLGGWAVKARWSSDGRYLAIVRAAISSYPAYSTDLVVLEPATGKLSAKEVTPQKTESRHYVDDFAWAPDNRHLLAVGRVSSYHNVGPPESAGLYLVDFVSDQVVSLLPAYTFYANMSQDNLAWSPDGSKVLIRCPTQVVDRICLISVRRTEK